MFSLDVEICKQFDKIVISGKKSRIVEELIKQFLEKKTPERKSTISQAMSKPSLAKKEVSKVV